MWCYLRPNNLNFGACAYVKLLYVRPHPYGWGEVSPEGNGCYHCQSSWRRVSTGSGKEGSDKQSWEWSQGKIFSSLCILKLVWSAFWARELPGAVPVIGIEPCQGTVEADQEMGSKGLWYSHIPKSTGFVEGYHLDSTELLSNHEMTWIRGGVALSLSLIWPVR